MPINLITLTHWGRVTHICVVKQTIIGSDKGLSPVRRQAIIWTNAGILVIGPLGTNFSEFLIAIQTFSFKKMHLKMSSGKWRPFCLSLNVLNQINTIFTDAQAPCITRWEATNILNLWIRICWWSPLLKYFNNLQHFHDIFTSLPNNLCDVGITWTLSKHRPVLILLLTKIIQTSVRFRAWLSNYIHTNFMRYNYSSMP